jgi:hypothetical protein
VHRRSVRVSRFLRALPILAALGLAGGGLAFGVPLGSGAHADAASAAAGSLSFQPVLGLPAREVSLIGAAGAEVSGEPNVVWAQAHIGAVPASVEGRSISNADVLLRHSSAGGWQIVPIAATLGEGAVFTPEVDRVTPAGGIALLGSAGAGKQAVLVRNPTGAFAVAPQPPSSGPEAVLGSGEALMPAGSPAQALIAALDEPGHTGVAIAPAVGNGSSVTTLPPGVLHFDGTHWSREALCTQEPTCAPPSGITPLALVAGSSQTAWLLASSSVEPLMLFKRVDASGGEPMWLLQHPSSWVFGAGTPPSHVSVFARRAGSGPMLTSTEQGVWVDGQYSLEGNVGDLTAFVSANGQSVGGPWCYPNPAGVCHDTLAAPLPSSTYQSSAWSGSAYGTRVIAGLPHGALLSFNGERFSYMAGGGGYATSSAAFASADEGWLGGASGGGGYREGAQLLHVTTGEAPDDLQSWPVPFRRPLTALAAQPGRTPGEAGAQALAVGDFGQIARYVPGQGWTPEFLYNGSGQRKEPSLRGVAWPEPGRAYAVGSEGEMWLYRSETGLWEPDPAKPLGFHGNLTAIAFSPSKPSLGYAVGKQGVLLSYDKTWTQEAPPPGLEKANFTSVAFAGGEALAGYRLLASEGHEVGGLIVNEGTGWRIETGRGSAQQLLAQLSDPDETVISKVAGLTDGGAVAAGPGVVIERDSAGSPWRFAATPLPEAANIAALAAIRAAQEVRALVSVDIHPNSLPDGQVFQTIDNPESPAAGQPSLLIGPDPLPVTGYLLRETAAGWEDLENQAYPEPDPSLPESSGIEQDIDLPGWPDPVLALLVDPAGDQGWAVGGQTGAFLGQSVLTAAGPAVQTAAALRLGGGAAPSQSSGASIAIPSGQATFALAGNAQCADACADYAGMHLGPDAWLSSALSRAAQISGLHAFLYTGARLGQGGGRPRSADAFQREMNDYAGLLRSGGALNVYAAASPSDVDLAGGTETFSDTLGSSVPAGTVPAGAPTPPAHTAAYAFDSPGVGGTVRVIVLDYSQLELGAPQLQWLASQLDAARAAALPAIVMGNADPVEPVAPNFARDAAALIQVLTQHGASAYLYDSPGENRIDTLGAGPTSVPAYGTGTLGYVLPPAPTQEDFLGAGGVLLTSVDVAARNPATNQAPVSVSLVPNISQLALDATNGTLLRRSQVALFEGLARRPLGGGEQIGGGTNVEEAPDPYVPVPELCHGSTCGHFIAPAYSFSSSRPDIGNFVEQDPNNANPRAVLQGSGGKPVPDPHSGLFCAFNAGTTVVTIQAGGLSYSEPVTVQAGSVEQPCGTVPLINPPLAVSAATLTAPPPPAGAPSGGSPAPVTVPPPPVPGPVPAAAPQPSPPHPVVHPAPSAFFTIPAPVPALVVAPFLPPPLAARPIPPSGTATIFSTAVAPKEESEDEEAIESARANMAAYHPEDPHVPPFAILALLVIAAGAGTSIIRVGRSRRGRAAPALARARPDKRF